MPQQKVHRQFCICKYSYSCINLFGKTKIALGYMNVILLHNNHPHVSAIHVVILREIRTRIHPIMCWNHSTVTNYNCICVLCNDNQPDALFILNLFHQSTSACFGHIYCPSSGGFHCVCTETCVCHTVNTSWWWVINMPETCRGWVMK
jgi:hypothetical protein